MPATQRHAASSGTFARARAVTENRPCALAAAFMRSGHAFMRLERAFMRPGHAFMRPGHACMCPSHAFMRPRARMHVPQPRMHATSATHACVLEYACMRREGAF